MLRRPAMQDLSSALADVARAIATRLRARGARAWIVGGAVRDLALGRRPEDVDMGSPATPDVVEEEFERTIPLGRSFGTLIVRLQGLDVEHTTFRTDDRSSDARHPDAVSFGARPEEDATRRDFTCNALYLDPLTDEVLDPTGGLQDLAARRLRAVGDPARRFAEDGLRLVRLARFSGALGLEPDPELLSAARAAADALRGVSRERVRREWEAAFRRGGAARTLEILAECELLDRTHPHLGPSGPGRAAWISRRAASLRAIGERPGPALGFAALLGPDPESGGHPRAAALRELTDLKPSSVLRRQVVDAWDLVAEFDATRDPPRSTRVRWMRRPGFESALGLARATALVSDRGTPWIERLADEWRALGELGIEARAWLSAADLLARGIAPGPTVGALLAEAETRQLDGLFQDREDALRWLDRRLHDGGNSARNPNAIG